MIVTSFEYSCRQTWLYVQEDLLPKLESTLQNFCEFMMKYLREILAVEQHDQYKENCWFKSKYHRFEKKIRDSVIQLLIA